MYNIVLKHEFKEHLTVILPNVLSGKSICRWLKFLLIISVLCSSVNELLKIKEDLTKERDEILGEIVKLREQLAQSSSTQQHLEEQKNEAEEKIQEVK